MYIQKISFVYLLNIYSFITMNYIKLINTFWDKAPDLDGYKSDYGILYFSILDAVNRRNWKDVEIEYDRIIYQSKLGKRMYLDGRRWLKENGFITLIEGKGDYQKAKFGIPFEVQKCTAQRTASSTAIAPHNAPHQAPIIYTDKQVNIKTNKTEEEKEKEIFQEKISALTLENEKLKQELSEKKGKSQKESSAKEKGNSKIVHGEHENVFLSLQEAQKLFDKYGKEKFQKMVERLSVYKLNGKKYKSDYGAILNWVVKAIEDDEVKQSSISNHNQPKKGKIENLYDNMKTVLSELNSHEQYPIINQ